MSRVIEGTSMGGFVCDQPGCTAKAVYAPVVCVPWEGFPPQEREPIQIIKDTHVCLKHRTLTVDDVLPKATRLLVEELAVANDGRPDFKWTFIMYLMVHSPKYQEFLEKNGLVKPGDSTPAGEGKSVIIPNGLKGILE